MTNLAALLHGSVTVVPDRPAVPADDLVTRAVRGRDELPESAMCSIRRRQVRPGSLA